MDEDTERLMEGIIESDFRHCTVLAVMHRLEHVVRYDKVALLDSGKLKEYGMPRDLIAADGEFAGLYRASLERRGRGAATQGR